MELRYLRRGEKGAEAAGPRMRACPRLKGSKEVGAKQSRIQIQAPLASSWDQPDSFSGRQKAKRKQLSWLKSSGSSCCIDSPDDEEEGPEP